jgi:hypothetical protein
VRRGPQLLTATPDQDLEAIVKTAAWFTWPGWDRFLVAWCSLFHLAAAWVLATAPYKLVWTEGTAPVLELASRYVWAVDFAAAGLLSWALLRTSRALVQMACWFVVMVTGGLWVTAFSLAVLRGEGSALGIVVWPFLYGPWAIVAVRVGLGRR